MKIFPAIDIKDGKCVRLRQGKAEDATVYGADPVEAALSWEARGAEFLHIVDLDGAFAGRPVHTDLFREMGRRLRIPFEVGGGLRTDEDARAVLDAGAARVIVGSRVVSDPASVRRLVDAFGASRIVVGIDARDGFVQVAGWTETTAVRATDLAWATADAGARLFIFTDTATDGMLSGPNVAALTAFAAAVPDARVVASGGVATAADVRALRASGVPNLEGVVIGKALYEGTETLAAFLEAAR